MSVASEYGFPALVDAVNEVINLDNLKDVDVYCRCNALTVKDEFGPMTKLFSDSDPDIVGKVRRLWGDFLQRRSCRTHEERQQSRSMV